MKTTPAHSPRPNSSHAGPSYAGPSHTAPTRMATPSHPVAPSRGSLQRAVAAALLVAVTSLSGPGATAQPQPGPSPDWPRLRESVVEMRVLVTGRDPVVVYGFALEGIDGIVTCQSLVAGAEQVLMRTRAGDIFEAERYVAHDPTRNLVVIETDHDVPGLDWGSHLMFSQRQFGLVLLPPSVGQHVYPMRFLNDFLAPEAGELLACWGDISPGLPYADSLGAAVGVVQVLERGEDRVVCAVPIERVREMMAQPDRGGRLEDLPAEKAAFVDPATAAGAQVMGAVLCRSKRFGQGVSYLMQALEQDPRSHEAKLEWGMALQLQRDFAAAETFYLEALALEPGSARAHLYLGSCHFTQGDYDQAGTAYEEAIATDPGWALPLVNMGGLQYLRGDVEQAERLMKKALEMKPDMGLALFNLGMLYYARGQTDEGSAILEQLRARRSGFATLLLERI